MFRYLVCVTALVAILQVSPEVPRKAIQSQDSRAKSDKTNTASKQQPAKSSPVVNSQQSANPQIDGQSKTSEAEQKNVTVTIPSLPQVNVKKDILDKAYDWATVLIALATLILAGTAWKQASAAKVSAVAARASADAFINVERAWLLVDTGEITDDFIPDPNQIGFLDVRPIVKNYGRTSARITRVAIRFHEVSTLSDLPPEPEYQNENATDTILPPGVTIQPLRTMIPLSDFIEIRRGAPVLFIYGFLNYLIFGNEERQSRFCFVYHVPGGFDSTHRGFYLANRVPKAYTQCT